jgi:hypothetical protein
VFRKKTVFYWVLLKWLVIIPLEKNDCDLNLTLRSVEQNTSTFINYAQKCLETSDVFIYGGPFSNISAENGVSFLTDFLNDEQPACQTIMKHILTTAGWQSPVIQVNGDQ